MSDLEDDVYIVEKILKKKRNEDGEIRYLVKWDGYESSENTWEPPKNFSRCPQVLESFEEKLRRKEERRDRKKKADISGSQNSSAPARDSRYIKPIINQVRLRAYFGLGVKFSFLFKFYLLRNPGIQI